MLVDLLCAVLLDFHFSALIMPTTLVLTSICFFGLSKEVGTAVISLYSLYFSTGDRINLLLDPSTKSISLEEVNSFLVGSFFGKEQLILGILINFNIVYLRNHYCKLCLLTVVWPQRDLIDIKLTPNKLWILRENGLVMKELFCQNRKE